MALEEKVISYELLFRINPDWTVRGAHMIEETGVFRTDGSLVSSSPGEAQRIAAGIAKDGLDLSAILGNLAAGLVLERDSQAATIAAHEATIAEQAAQLAERAPVQAEIDAANANVQRLLAEVARLGGNPESLTDSGVEQPGSAAEPGQASDVEAPTP